MQTKRCSACGIEKPITSFDKRRTKEHVRYSDCQACRLTKKNEVYRERKRKQVMTDPCTVAGCQEVRLWYVPYCRYHYNEQSRKRNGHTRRWQSEIKELARI